MRCKYCTTRYENRPGEWVDGYCPVCQQNILRSREFHRQQERINNPLFYRPVPGQPGRYYEIGDGDIAVLENN